MDIFQCSKYRTSELDSNSINKIHVNRIDTYQFYIAIYKETLKLVEHKYLEILKVWSYTEKTLTRKLILIIIILFN